MSAAIAMAPSPAPHDRSAFVDIAPSTAAQSSPPNNARRGSVSATPNHPIHLSDSVSPNASKDSPNAYVSLNMLRFSPSDPC